MAAASREQTLHPRVRIERLAFDNADRREGPPGFAAQCVDGLSLDDLVEGLEVAEVAGSDRVVALAGDVHEFGGWRVACRLERVHLQVVLDVLQRRRQSVGNGAAHEEPVDVGGRLEHEVAVGHVAGVTRRQNEILAALAPVRAGDAEVTDIAHPCIVQHAEHAGWHFHHGRPVGLQVEMTDGVHRGGVSGQVQRVRVEQLLGHGNLVGLAQTNRRIAGNDAVDGQRADVVEEHFDGPHAVEVVVDRVDGGVGRHAVEELQLADGRLDLVWGSRSTSGFPATPVPAPACWSEPTRRLRLAALAN